MRYRIAAWATAGLLVAIGWGVYFASADKASPIQPLVYFLVRVTQPVIAVIIAKFQFPVGLRLGILVNTATYALAGLIVERMRSRRIS